MLKKKLLVLCRNISPPPAPVFVSHSELGGMGSILLYSVNVLSLCILFGPCVLKLSWFNKHYISRDLGLVPFGPKILTHEIFVFLSLN